MLATPMDGGLFQLSSRLKLQKGSISPKYTCTVFSASGGREGEATWEPKPKTDGTSRFGLLGLVLLLSTTTTQFSCCCSLSYGGCKSVISTSAAAANLEEEEEEALKIER